MSEWVVLGALALGGYTLYKAQQNITNKNPIDSVTGNGDPPIMDMMNDAAGTFREYYGSEIGSGNVISAPLETLKQRHQWKHEQHPHAGKHKRSKVPRMATQQQPIQGLINNGGNQQLG